MRIPRKLCAILLPILLHLASQRAVAQAPAYTHPQWRTELFAGFSSLRARPGKDLDRTTLNGWTLSATTYQFFPRWGLTAEFSGNGKDGASQRSFLFGGTYRGLQRRRIALTGRILAGVTAWDPALPRPGSYREQTAFTFGFGQSIDFGLSRNLALRLQPDLRFVRLRDASNKANLTILQPISVGLVYQFGSR